MAGGGRGWRGVAGGGELRSLADALISEMVTVESVSQEESNERYRADYRDACLGVGVGGERGGGRLCNEQTRY